jgi:putative membrane protein
MRAVARAVLGKIRVRVDGVENVPASGPALLVCRHHHHLYDGAALVLAIRRPVRMIVGLDWVKDQGQRAYMEACATRRKGTRGVTVTERANGAGTRARR